MNYTVVRAPTSKMLDAIQQIQAHPGGVSIHARTAKALERLGECEILDIDHSNRNRLIVAAPG